MPGDGIRDEYARHPKGAPGFYLDHGAGYRNPHEDAVAAMVEHAQRAGLIGARVLDLACGSGEVTLALAPGSAVTACDPYTGAAFTERTGRVCQPWSFADLAGGVCQERFDTIVCAYALHLCELSWLPSLCLALADLAPTLVVITPHKRPELRPEWGWTLESEHRDPAYRVRLRAYRSVMASEDAAVAVTPR